MLKMRSYSQKVPHVCSFNCLLINRVENLYNVLLKLGLTHLFLILYHGVNNVACNKFKDIYIVVIMVN